jgi:5-methylcytosine-specific restriction endonuclease McrA
MKQKATRRTARGAERNNEYVKNYYHTRKTSDPLSHKCQQVASQLKRQTRIGQLRELWESQGNLCAISGETITPQVAEIDHIMPKSRGGSHQINNLQWLHKVVNRMKHSLLEPELVEWCGRIWWHNIFKGVT